MTAPPAHIIVEAASYARRSPCQKSKRGAVIYSPGNPEVPIGVGFNSMPQNAFCDGSPTCRRDCGKSCAHAEQRAIRDGLMSHRKNKADLSGFELVHVKVVDGTVVAGGGPSCWQCARDIADVGLDAVWLYQTMWTPTEPGAPDQWVRYTAAEFLIATLSHEKLHPFVEHKLCVGSTYECACGYQPSSEDDLANHMAAEMVSAGMGFK